MKSIRNLAFMSMVGLVGLWSCNSKQYATNTAQEYDDLYGNSADGEVFAGNSTQYSDEDRASRSTNPDYRTGKAATTNQNGQADYYDESYLSARGIGRNYSPNGGYNSGFANGYNTAASNWNWGWSNPWRSSYFGNGWNTMGGMSLMLGGFNSPWCMNGWNAFGSPYGYGSMYSPYGGGYGSMYAYDPFGFNSYGYGSPFGYGYGSGFGYNSYGGYGNRYYNNTNIFYSSPSYSSNSGFGVVDNANRRTQDYNRMNRSGSTRNDGFDNSASYSGRRGAYSGTSSSGTSQTYSNGDVTNGGRSRGNSGGSYYGSDNGSNSRGYSSGSTTTTDNSSNYSGRSRGNSSSTYYGNSGNSNSNSSGYSSGRSSSSSSDYSGGGRSSGYSGGSSSSSGGGSSSGGSSSGGGGGRSGGPR